MEPSITEAPACAACESLPGSSCTTELICHACRMLPLHVLQESVTATCHHSSAYGSSKAGVLQPTMLVRPV